MRYGLSLDWQRCPDGVEVIQRERLKGLLGVSKDSSGKAEMEPCFRHRTGARHTIRHELRDLSNPLATQFVNARSIEELEAFLSEVGLPGSHLPYPPGLHLYPLPLQAEEKRSKSRVGKRSRSIVPDEEVPLSSVVAERNTFERILRTWQDDRFAGIVALNRAVQLKQTLRLEPHIEMRRGESTPGFTLIPVDLYAFMLMEIALMFVGGGTLIICSHCGAWFVTGTGSAKRAHSQYCSDRCRVASMRARKRATS